ncbi:MAG: ATP-binding cassette domain-containing protein [Hyphomicrobiales bacterium]
MPDATVISLEEWAVEQAFKVCAQVDNIIYKAGSQTLLDGLSFCLRNGGITALMGPNGAGKTLTLRLLARLLIPSQGHVKECGISSKEIAFVFQKPVLLRRSVEANLHHALKLYGVPKSERSIETSKLLELSDLAHLSARSARRLSGGEQQRLAMVRALAAKPKLLLLDEPTASLDPQATASIEKLIEQAAQNGTKVVLVTHDPGQAKRLASDVVFISNGSACEHTEAAKFFDNPKSIEASAYLAGRLLI